MGYPEDTCARSGECQSRIGLANGTIVNGVTLATGNVIFVGSQSAPVRNGLYEMPASGAASRASWADSAAELAKDGVVFGEWNDYPATETIAGNVMFGRNGGIYAAAWSCLALRPARVLP